MHTMEQVNSVRVARACAIVVLFFFVWSARARADDFGALDRLGQAEGEEYVNLRSALLRSPPDTWDVKEACAHSWEAGLAAYILNARSSDSERFADWDAEVEANIRGGHIISPAGGLTRARVSVAYRLEFGWKPPEYLRAFNNYAPSPYEAARPGALHRSTLLPDDAGESRALCRVLWENCEIPEFREVAIRSLAHSDAPEDRREVVEVLLNERSSLGIRRAALTGYTSKYASGTVETLVKLATHPQTPEELASRAVTYVGSTPFHKQQDPRAHSALRDIASNPHGRVVVRCAAMAACALDPRPEDVEILRAALTQSELSDLQLAAIRAVSTSEANSLCPELRVVLYDYTSVDAVYAATAALLKLGGEEEFDLIRTYVDDPNVAEEARQRARSELHRVEQHRKADELKASTTLEELRRKRASQESTPPQF